LHKLLKKIALGLNILAATALLISYLSALISPAITVIPSFFALAYPYILLLNIFFIILWGVRQKKEVFISVLAILIGLTHFNNNFRFGRNEPTEYDFQVVSYNVRLFNQYEDKTNSKADIISVLIEDSPGIICLQEVYLDGSQDIRTGLTRYLQGQYDHHLKAVSQGRYGFYGISTVSVYPIVGRGDIVHPKSSSLTIYTDLRIGSDTIRVYNNHLQSFRLKRMQNSFIEEISGISQTDPVDEIRNLSTSLKDGFVQRALQSKRVREHIKSSPYPVIVCGDFNDTPVSYSYRKMRSGLKDAFVEAGHGAGFTYRDKYPANRIDYILYDELFECSGFDINRVRFSDHYPVKAYFRLPGEKGVSQNQHSPRKE